MLVMKFPFPVANPNTFNYPEQFTLSSAATIVVLVVLIPIVEEILFRGLLFGSLRNLSRPLAWIVSVAVYCFYGVWLFAFLPSGGVDLRYLLLAFQYIPTAVALTFCYERSGTVWASILLHGITNAMFLFSTLSTYTIL